MIPALRLEALDRRTPTELCPVCGQPTLARDRPGQGPIVSWRADEIDPTRYHPTRPPASFRARP